jgi:D-amino peptidase
MRVFLAVDMEGVTGVVHPDQLTPDGRNYSQAQKYLVADVNAVINGILDVYPEAEITVGDGHATMRNVLLEELHTAAQLVIGAATLSNKPLCKLEGVQFGADAAMCIGYHTKAGTQGGLLAHTYIGSLIAELRMNGQAVGEVQTNAAVLSSLNVPLVLVSGNSDLESEVRAWTSSTAFVATKRTLGPTAAICKTPERTARELREAASKAMISRETWYLHDIGSTRFEVDTKQPEQCERACSHPQAIAVSSSTFAVEADNAADAFRHLWSVCLTALGDLPFWLR